MTVLTLPGICRDGQVFLLESPPDAGEYKVLVVFLELEEDVVVLSRERHEELLLATAQQLLTKRELEVLVLAQTGISIHEIALALELGEGTVRNCLSCIYTKLKVKNRTEAIFKAIQLGILQPPEVQ